jgi:hypothetical protein
MHFITCTYLYDCAVIIDTHKQMNDTSRVLIMTQIFVPVLEYSALGSPLRAIFLHLRIDRTDVSASSWW